MNDEYTYTPTRDEIACARVVAEIRNSTGSGSNLPTETATEEELLEQHFRSCVAEIAVSRTFNLCWTGCGPQEIDVGNIYEVRSVRSMRHGLLVRARDKDDFPIVLVHVDPQYRCTLIGWHMIGKVKKRGKQVGGSHPYWLMTQDQLLPMTDAGLMVA